jgi:hypothetical protein
MKRYAENPWFRTALLLCAMAAGALMTQLIPSYEEMAARRDQPATPPAAAETHNAQPNAATGVDVDRRQLIFVGMIA